jgi:hypothetical protein
MRNYSPRRQSKRWLDADCPAGVLAIFDDPRTCDRFTIFYREVNDDWIDYRAASSDPFNPCGIGLYCQIRTWEARNYRYANGHRKVKWSSLPDDVKRLVRQDLA